MGIDYYSCKRCGRVFPDVIDYVYCECGNEWCCDKCAEEDGYKYGIEIDEDGDEVFSLEGSSCKYCRMEDFNDDELFEFALHILHMTRDDLVSIYLRERDEEKLD